MRFTIILLLAMLLFSCKEKQTNEITNSDRIKILNDSIKNIYKYKIDVDFDTVGGEHEYYNTIMFQKIDSNKLCFNNSFYVLDVKQIDSLTYGLIVTPLEYQNIHITLITRDKELSEEIVNIKSSRFGYTVLFNLYPKSFDTSYLIDINDELSKVISGQGKLIALFKQPSN